MMGYAVQKFLAPDGTEMIALPAVDFERMQQLLEDAEDVADADVGLARINAGEGTMPADVLDLILDEGVTPLLAWRRVRGLSQADLARRTGLSQVFVSKIERGDSQGSAKTRSKLAEALDAPLWTLDVELSQTTPRPSDGPGYWVYENWTRKRARVHQSHCSHCNAGKGSHRLSGEKNGRWIGPFEQSEEAMKAAAGLGQADTANCGHCAP